ncbi:MAG: hypothetical protein MUF64_28590 [Polyangiaceae bacterium]|nr:hypothetical protein [Polyangiaceae bacterium]
MRDMIFVLKEDYTSARTGRKWILQAVVTPEQLAAHPGLPCIPQKIDILAAKGGVLAQGRFARMKSLGPEVDSLPTYQHKLHPSQTHEQALGIAVGEESGHIRTA